METDITTGEIFTGIIVLIILIEIYLIPTTIAICRKAYYSAAAITINILLGWTFLGWVLALVLSLLNKPDRMPQQIVINHVVGDKNNLSKTKKQKDEE